MSFLVDQNLPSSLAARLTAAGEPAQHTSDLGLERALDEDIFEWCRHTIATHGHAVFSMAPDRPTRAQLLPLISDSP